MSNFIDISVTGFEQMRNRLSMFVTRFPNEVAASLTTEAELIMTESKREVPVDTGALRDSGFVEQPIIANNNVSIKLGYGGVATRINPESGDPTTSYAFYVHEDMTAHHESGNAKFLEQPIFRNREKLMSRIAYRVKRLLESVGAV